MVSLLALCQCRRILTSPSTTNQLRRAQTSLHQIPAPPLFSLAVVILSLLSLVAEMWLRTIFLLLLSASRELFSGPLWVPCRQKLFGRLPSSPKILCESQAVSMSVILNQVSFSRAYRTVAALGRWKGFGHPSRHGFFLTTSVVQLSALPMRFPSLQNAGLLRLLFQFLSLWNRVGAAALLQWRFQSIQSRMVVRTGWIVLGLH
mmetsp:Transcript_60306/g.123934  ORF Transcript_60306/g.123934 Transcript_60306/m.123934 type:complete len:204 (-) Transcript_60306:978-1589(-)